jgi:hypothetical protein
MRKIFTLSVVVIFAVSLLSSCRAPHKCEAYSKVATKVSNRNS